MVFLTFAFFGQRDIAEFGIGLAAAVALDAFLLRTILVPALMHIFGDANWWLPRWLDHRLPHLAIELAARSASASGSGCGGPPRQDGGRPPAVTGQGGLPHTAAHPR